MYVSGSSVGPSKIISDEYCANVGKDEVTRWSLKSEIFLSAV